MPSITRSGTPGVSSPSVAADRLPEPDAERARQSDELERQIVEACTRGGGSIGFDEYMERALYTPRLGYYSAPSPRIGEDGDFVTAPEISERFAHALARPVADALAALGDATVLEVGAGRGTLARGVIETLEARGVAFDGYWILERSASARAEQRATLGRHADSVQWLERWPERPLRGVVIANELLDAIAAQRFVVRGDRVLELRVSHGEHGLGYVEHAFTDAAAATRLTQRLSALGPLPDGYRSEFAPAREAWIASLAQTLRAGLVLLADYGYPRREYYHPQRVNGTLACHYRHRVHDDPFFLPGLSDLSVHVEFTALAERAIECGLRIAGFTTQAHFLLENGLLDGLDDPALSISERASAAHAVRRLTLPGEMGEAVKFIALARDLEQPVSGFTQHDMLYRL